jgi:cation diffusion facilitator family transporter
MGASCCGSENDLKTNENNKAFIKILWIALILNFAMFFVEVIFGVLSHSLSLRADAIDFFGDCLNYFVTLFVISSAIQTKAKVSLAKAAFMLTFGAWVLVQAIISFFSQQIPDSFTMSWVGFLALIVNGLVAFLLFKYKDGDSNMKSVWLCSRNDAIGNLAVIIASGGVFWWGQKWPDLLVAIFMSGLAITSAFQVIKIARVELLTGIKNPDSDNHHGHSH